MEDGVAIGDIEPQKRRRIWPCWFGIEHHHHRVADADLRVTNRAVLHLHACELRNIKRRFEKRNQPRSVAGDDPGRYRGIALWDRLDLLPVHRSASCLPALFATIRGTNRTVEFHQNGMLRSQS